MRSNFFPCFPALYGGPVLTGAPPPGHGQVWAKPPSIVRGGASLHAPGPLSGHVAGSKPPVISTCYTDIGEALLPGHHTCRLQVKQTQSLRFRRIQFLYWRWRDFWIYSFVCASMFCVWDVFFFYFFLLRKFLCLGQPLMCLADKVAMRLQLDCHPPVKAPVSNGTYLFCYNNLIFLSCLLVYQCRFSR